jgi:hypothetical protein
MPGCPEAHVLTINGVERKFKNEVEFKKFLAKGGLLELSKSGDITVDLGFMKDFYKPASKEGVKSTIIRTTEGKGKGKMITVDDMKSLKDQIILRAKAALEGFKKGKAEGEAKGKEAVADLKEKQRTLEDVVGGLRDEIKIQLKNAKNEIFKGADIKGSVAYRMLTKLNNAKTPIQLLSAMDHIEKSLTDIDYNNKLTKAEKLSAKALSVAKNLPLNVGKALTELARTKPKEIQDLIDFNKTVEDAINNATGEAGISEAKLKDLADRIKLNNVKAKLLRAMNLMGKNVEGFKTITEIPEYMGTSLKDMEAALKTFKEFKENDYQGDETTGGEKRDVIDAINEVLRDELADADTSNLSKEDKEVYDALMEVDTSDMSNQQATFLNNAINNFVENGKFDGVGQYILNEYRIQKEFTPERIKLIQDGMQKMNMVARTMERYRTLPTKIEAVTVNQSVAAAIRVATGLDKHVKAYGSENGFSGRIDRMMKKVADMAETTGIAKSMESQVKIGTVLDLLQYKKNSTPAEILQEFTDRKEAMLQGIKNAENNVATDSEFAEMYGDQVEAMRKVYTKDVEKSKTPQELLATLSSKEREFRDFALKSFNEIKPGLQRISEIYRNKEFQEWDNYYPRTYLRQFGWDIMSDPTKETPFKTSTINDLNTFGGRTEVDTESSTAFDDRTLSGKSVPKNSFINYSVLDTFQDEYRKQLYDLTTADTRSYIAQALISPKFVEAMKNDNTLVRLFQRSFDQRIRNEKNDLIRGMRTNGYQDFAKYWRNTGNRIALGGFITPWAKQAVPTMASAIINTIDEPTLAGAIFSARGKDRNAYREFVRNSPVARRHAQEVQFINSQITAQDIKGYTSAFSKAIGKVDERANTELMRALRSGDQSSASTAFAMHYVYYLLKNGKLKNAYDFNFADALKNPNREAMAYAEQMTSTTLNINEAVDRAASRGVLGSIVPFASFSINAKQNLAINIGRAFNRNLSGQDRRLAGRRIGAHLAEIIAINATSLLQREIFMASGGALAMGAAAVMTDDERQKQEMLTAIREATLDQMGKAVDNTYGYMLADLVTGQIAENFTAPIAQDISSGINRVYSSFKGVKPKEEQRKSFPYESLKYAGVYGIPAKKLADAFDNFAMFNHSDEFFREQKFGYINAKGELTIPKGYETIERPDWINAAYLASSVANLSSFLLGGSSQEVASIFRVIPRVAGKTETTVFGKDKNAGGQLIPDENNIYNYSPLQDDYATIPYQNIDYYLNPQQLKEYSKYRMDILSERKKGTDKEFYDKTLKQYSTMYSTLQSTFTQMQKESGNKVYEKVLKRIKINEIPADKDIAKLVDLIAQYKMIAKYLNKKDRQILNLDVKDEVTKE